jgi:hypothetical protein
MTGAAQMLDTYPNDFGRVDKEKLRACIEACVECAQACTACVDACLSKDMVGELTKCAHQPRLRGVLSATSMPVYRGMDALVPGPEPTQPGPTGRRLPIGAGRGPGSHVVLPAGWAPAAWRSWGIPRIVWVVHETA